MVVAVKKKTRLQLQNIPFRKKLQNDKERRKRKDSPGILALVLGKFRLGNLSQKFITNIRIESKKNIQTGAVPTF